MKKTGSLPRCVSCRKKFWPQPSARVTQKVCSRACRLVRRRRNGRKRRRSDLNAYREDERARQRDSRTRRRRRGEARPKRGVLSRTSLGAEARVLVGDFLEIWDKTQALSRTSLKRELLRAVVLEATKRGQKSAERPDVTDQPFS